MGAIYICKKDKVSQQSAALDLFQEMGFSVSKTLEVGEWKLFAYQKMVGGQSNIVSDGNCTLISIGTPIYKGMNYSGSLTTLLADFCGNGIAFDRLKGQYTLFFCHDGGIDVLCDPLGCKHLFTDTSLNTLSSHMLPLCRGINGDIHINRKAFYEKFLTGFIMPPNTLFEEVIEIDRRTAERISNAGTGIRFITSPKICINTAKAKSFQECLKEQAETLHAHFESLRDICEGGVDIGLSGGYDSRLVLACLHRTKTVPIHLHSHSTENDHKKDLGIAQKMADYIGIQCHTIPTKKLSHSDNTDEILKKSVLYFDGRSSFSIGGCGEVYTASYRESSTENTPFTLTGIGGELYRNVFDIGFRKIRFDRFMRGKVFSSSFRKAIPDDKYREICSDVIERAAERLDIDKRRRQSKAIAHRYYCEIMMPNGQGAALDAYNQVSCCTAPFLEPAIITKGYETIPFHHSGGDFEGKLIERIDQGLAAIPSSYGYPIASRPITARIKEALRTYIPASLWEKLVKALKNKPKRNSGSDNYEKLYVSSRTLKEAYAYMADLFPEINFSCLLHSGEDIRRVQFIAMTLYMSRERIKTK